MRKEDYIKWKHVPGTADVEVSNMGDVRTTGGYHYSPIVNKKGYKMVSLWINGEMKRKQIHRLVAEAFVPNPYNKPEVNHKNGDRGNNCIWNLEWSTTQENILHSIFVLGKDMSGKNNPMFGMRGEDSPSFVDWVLAFKDNELVGRYPTQIAAAAAMGWKRSVAQSISRCVRHFRNVKQVRGYVFMYEKEYDKLRQADLKPCELLEHPELWVKTYRGQSAAKPQKYINAEEGSTTIESIGVKPEEASRVENSVLEVQGLQK